MVSDDLIAKNPHPGDGRRAQLTLTEQGINLLIRLAALQRKVNDALFGILTREEFTVLSQMLSRLASNADSTLKLAEHVRATLTSPNSKTFRSEPQRSRKKQRTRR